MESYSDLVQEYINATDEQRLGLFLTYRDMRDVFSRIEQEGFENDIPDVTVEEVEKIAENSSPQPITEYCREWLNSFKSWCGLTG